MLNWIVRAFRRPHLASLIVSILCFGTGACVVGLIAWKATSERQGVLMRNEAELRNLAHSLSQHAVQAIQSADVALRSMVELLKYQKPLAERFNPFMAATVRNLPQLREIGMLSADGNWVYSSLPETPRYNNADREYFHYHRDAAELSFRIEAIQSRLTGRPTILMTRRITLQDGSFGGVLFGTIDTEYFANFYKSFALGEGGAINLVRTDGQILSRWPVASEADQKPTKTLQLDAYVGTSTEGYNRVVSPFDGLIKYLRSSVRDNIPCSSRSR